MTVTLANGKELTLPQDKLSENDIAFLKEKGTIAPPAPVSSEKAEELPKVIPDPDGKPNPGEAMSRAMAELLAK